MVKNLQMDFTIFIEKPHQEDTVSSYKTGNQKREIFVATCRFRLHMCADDVKFDIFKINYSCPKNQPVCCFALRLRDDVIEPFSHTKRVFLSLLLPLKGKKVVSFCKEGRNVNRASIIFFARSFRNRGHFIRTE